MRKSKALNHGRNIVVSMLRQMELANNATYPNVFRSRETLSGALGEFCKLDERGRGEFTATLNEYIGTAMQGYVITKHTVAGYRAGERSSEKIATLDREKWKDDPNVKLAEDSGVPFPTILSILNP
jgi:hypothetical protein